MRRTRTIVVLAIAMLLASAVSAHAAAPPANAECLACHHVTVDDQSSANVDFEVAAVDRATACNKCHWISPEEHPFHGAGSGCGCHLEYTSGDASRMATVLTTVGWFNSADSAALGAEELHEVHGQSSWPLGLDSPTSACSSCHGAVACEACHEDAAAHVEHVSGAAGGTTVAPWTAETCVGTDVGVKTTQSLEERAITCAASECHDSHGYGNPRFVDNESSSVHLEGTWRSYFYDSYRGGTASYSSTPGSRMTCVVDGSQLDFYAMRLADQGIVEVFVDGVLLGEVDLYSPVPQGIVEVFSTSVPHGQHEVVLELTGRKNPASYGTAVLFDYLTVAADANPWIPECASCHAPDHTQVHDAQAVTNRGCSNCHDMLVSEEHVSGDNTCGVCHRSQDGDVLAAIAAGEVACTACHATPAHRGRR